jgi:hypothetical protein
MEEKVITDTAIFSKGERLAMLSLTIIGERGAVIKSDLRLPQPHGMVFNSSFEALSAFQNAVDTTRERGWRMCHKGKPNWG